MNSENSQKSIVNSFFSIYNSYWKEEYQLSPQDLLLALETEIQWIDSIQLKSSAITEKVLKDFEEAFSPSILPEYFIFFLSSRSYKKLDTPLLKFPSTHLWGQCMELFSMGAQHNVLPFAYSSDGDGVYCIDLGNNGHVIPWFYGDLEPSRERILCSSFCDLLKILSRFLSSDIIWYGDQSTERKKCVDEIKSVDPLYFAGGAWGEWWEPRIYK